MQTLDAIASTFGILAPPAFVLLLAGVLGAQLFLVDRRRRSSRHVARLVEEYRARQRVTAEQLQRFMEEYEDEIRTVGDPGDNGAVADAYTRYRTRQDSAIHHLQSLSEAMERRQREETPAEAVAHQVLDWFANQQAAR